MQEIEGASLLDASLVHGVGMEEPLFSSVEKAET